MNKLLQEKLILTESLNLKIFNTDNEPDYLRIDLNDIISFGYMINKSSYVKLSNKGDILVPKSTIDLLRTQIPEKENHEK